MSSDASAFNSSASRRYTEYVGVYDADVFGIATRRSGVNCRIGSVLDLVRDTVRSAT
jgi:hypothetical protein